MADPGRNAGRRMDDAGPRGEALAAECRAILKSRAPQVVSATGTRASDLARFLLTAPAGAVLIYGEGAHAGEAAPEAVNWLVRRAAALGLVAPHLSRIGPGRFRYLVVRLSARLP